MMEEAPTAAVGLPLSNPKVGPKYYGANLVGSTTAWTLSKRVRPEATDAEIVDALFTVKIYILIAVGFLLLIMPLVSLLVDPLFIMIKMLTKIEVGSELYKIFQQEFPGAIVHAYIFNVTNSEAFRSGADHKLKVREVGPFVYREYRSNENFELDSEAGVMRYTPSYRAEFLPEDSIGDPRLINVTLPNAALLALASMIYTNSFWTKAAYNVLVNRLKSKAMLNLDVHSHLWGYDEPLITFGNTIMPGWITFNKMGILDRLYDKSAIPRIESGITTADKFRIKTLNGSPGLSVLGYDNPSKRSRCNTLEDVYEGLAYTPGITPKTPLRVYRNVFCRMLDLEFTGTRTMDYGPEAFVYRFSNNTFRIDPSTECLCKNYQCKNGVSDVSPCLFNMPMAISNGHFLNADPILYERIDGIHPDEQEHGSEIVVDPKAGAVLKTYFTLQINVDVQDVSFNTAAKPFSNMIVPFAYFKVIQADIPEDAKEKFRLLYFTIANVIRGTEICAFVLGLLILAFAARQIYWSVLCSKTVIGYHISKNKKGLKVIQVEEPLMDDRHFEQIRVLE